MANQTQTVTTELITAPPTSDSNQEHPVADLIDQYANCLRSIHETAQVVLPHAANWLIEEFSRVENKINQCLSASTNKSHHEESEYITFDCAHDFAAYYSATQELDRLSGNKAPEVLAKSLFMHIFSEFDAYSGRLLKLIYTRNNTLLKSITREISLADLLIYKDIDSVKASMLDKEIETFRRDSYIEQFSTLEKKFNITLRKFKEWGDFVELSQRRNLFTHNGGVVSEQYIVTCEREGVEFEKKPKTGDILTIDFEYFTKAVRLTTRVGMMLGYTLWSKLLTSDKDIFHRSLNESIYKYLTAGRWTLAAEFGEFALSDNLKKDSTDIEHRIRIVNTAIALKFSGQPEKCINLIKSYDWSASYRDFKLAIEVLSDNYSCAVEIMKTIGKSGEILDQSSYHTWPLFSKLREQPEFYDAYQEIYGEPYFKKPASIQSDLDNSILIDTKTIKKNSKKTSPKRVRATKTTT